MSIINPTTRTTLVNDKIRFSSTARNNPAIFMDYFPPQGDGEGYTGLEMLLVSLSGCSATAVTVLLGKMHKTVNGLTIDACGIRQEAPPYTFSRIDLSFTLVSPDVTLADLEKAIRTAESSLCPVWALLKGNVEIIVHHDIKAN